PEQSPELWVFTQDNLAQTYLGLEDWKNAATHQANVLKLYPSPQVYQRLSYFYHEKVFEYALAFQLNSQWLAAFPQDASAQAALAATHFTTGRFAEFSSRLRPLLANPELSAATKISLQMIEVANLLVLDQAAQVPAALTSLLRTIEAQPADF